MDWTPLRKIVPGNVAANMAADNPACPRNGRDVFRALSPHNVIVMACNIRIPSVIPAGIEDAAYREAHALLRAFRAEGTARIVSDTLTARV
ncbi:MAG: hypothetical protein ACXWWW_02880 [Candidatus Deferrimicrobiaceae bacterium]